MWYSNLEEEHKLHMYVNEVFNLILVLQMEEVNNLRNEELGCYEGHLM